MVTLLDTKNEAIAKVNDAVRKALANFDEAIAVAEQGVKFQLVHTPGIAATLIDAGKGEALLKAVADFDAFTDDNDPYGQRDFAALEVDGTTVFFKIDLYNTTLDGGSENPLDHAQTVRVVTLMLPSEY